MNAKSLGSKYFSRSRLRWWTTSKTKASETSCIWILEEIKHKHHKVRSISNKVLTGKILLWLNSASQWRTSLLRVLKPWLWVSQGKKSKTIWPSMKRWRWLNWLHLCFSVFEKWMASHLRWLKNLWTLTRILSSSLRLKSPRAKVEVLCSNPMTSASS